MLHAHHGRYLLKMVIDSANNKVELTTSQRQTEGDGWLGSFKHYHRSRY